MSAFSRMRPRRPRRQRFGWLPALALGLFARSATADSVLVAVATNFAPVIETLGPAFERDTGHRLRRASGATGQLYAQILNGAPYDVLLAADAERPSRLAAEGLGVAASQFTYAEGRLVLYGPNAPALMTQGLAALNDPSLRRLAIANPALAPYGLAARREHRPGVHDRRDGQCGARPRRTVASARGAERPGAADPELASCADPSGCDPAHARGR
jgi:hypothetical protein